jgi:hypothetical protein
VASPMLLGTVLQRMDEARAAPQAEAKAVVRLVRRAGD